MSLHAQLSPEAQSRLHAQQRNSTITSIIISVLVVCLIGITLLYLLLPPIDHFSPEIVTYKSNNKDKPEVITRPMPRAFQPNPSAPSPSMADIIVSITANTIAIPTPEINVPDPSTNLGNGNDFGKGWNNGDGVGEGDGFKSLPPRIRKRCSVEDRLDRLEKSGGNKQCEEAVMKSLRWLKKTQNADGSWTGTNKGAMTGFALLAFLGHCETPNSEEFGDAVTRAIVYLTDLGMKNDGRLATADVGSHHWVYEHGIATYALAEAYTFCSSLKINLPNLAEVTKTAGDMIIQGQTDAGGWLYGYKSGGGGDNSVGFWQIQALKACKLTTLWEKQDFKTVSKKALEWLDKSQGSNGAIGYRGDSARSPGLTGGGVLALQMWGKGHSKNVRSGVDYIRNNTDFKWDEPSSDLYYHYYNAQAMINRGGADWEFYNNLFRDELLNNQNENGSWKNSNKHSGNLHMSTCLATFMLEVYYRFLPATGSTN